MSGESAEQRQAAEVEVQRSAALGEMQTRGEARPNRGRMKGVWSKGRWAQAQCPQPSPAPEGCVSSLEKKELQGREGWLIAQQGPGPE